jgi:ketosteroid isomerase-like protein
MASDNVELVHRAYRALEDGGLEEFLDYVDPEVEWHSLVLEIEGAFRGHEGVREWWRGLRAAFPDWRPSVEEVRDLGEHVIVHARGRGRGAESGVGIDDDFWQVARIREGRITWYRAVRTEEEALAAVRGDGP